jgi:hypothetical protein
MQATNLLALRSKKAQYLPKGMPEGVPFLLGNKKASVVSVYL